MGGLLPYKRRNANMIDRFFGDFFDSDWFYTDKVSKSVICKDNEKDYTYECVVAGFKKDDIKVELKGDFVVVKAQNENRSYEYTFNVPENCNTDKITGKTEDGILYLSIPKIVKEEPKAITIKID